MHKNGNVHQNSDKIKIIIIYNGKETTFKVEPEERIEGLTHFIKVIHPEVDMNTHNLLYNDQILQTFKENMKINDICKNSSEMKITILPKDEKVPPKIKIKPGKKQLLKLKNPLKLKEKINVSKSSQMEDVQKLHRKCESSDIGVFNTIVTSNEQQSKSIPKKKININKGIIDNIDNNKEVVFENNYEQDYKNNITNTLVNLNMDVICKCCHHFVIKSYCRECDEYTCENCRKVLHKKHPIIKINVKSNKQNIKEYGIIIKKDVNVELNKFNHFDLMCDNNESEHKNIYPGLKEAVFNKINELEKYYENFNNSSGYEKRYAEVKSLVNEINKNITENEEKITMEILSNNKNLTKENLDKETEKTNGNSDFNFTKKYFGDCKKNEVLLNTIKIKVNAYQEDDNTNKKIKNIFNRIEELLNEIKIILQNYAPPKDEKNNTKAKSTRKINKKKKKSIDNEIVDLNKENKVENNKNAVQILPKIDSEQNFLRQASALMLPTLINQKNIVTGGNVVNQNNKKIKRRISLLKIEGDIADLINLNTNNNIISSVEFPIPEINNLIKGQTIKNSEENKDDENKNKIILGKKSNFKKVGSKNKILLKKSENDETVNITKNQMQKKEKDLENTSEVKSKISGKENNDESENENSQINSESSFSKSESENGNKE